MADHLKKREGCAQRDDEMAWGEVLEKRKKKMIITPRDDRTGTWWLTKDR